MNRVDYSKVDPWVKKHPDGKYTDFIADNPKVPLSIWSFAKRRAKVLGLPMTPSMKPGYRSNKQPKEGDEGIFIDRRTKSVYTTVYSTPVSDLKKKNGLEAASEIIGALNRIFKLNLESAQVEVVGSGLPNFEIRKYSR